MATKTLHAVDYLAAPQKHAPRPVCAVFGDEPFLRRQVLLQLRSAVLGGGEDDFSLTNFEGGKTELRDVIDELSTIAMFGGQRLVIVDRADDFVSRYRAQLEDYAQQPAGSGVLVLELASFPANTRLFKAVAKTGLPIDCKAPSGVRLTRWLGVWAKQTHRVELPQSAAELLVEMIGPELGLLDQEIAKLALTVQGGSQDAGKQDGGKQETGAKGRKRITTELIGRSVGSWRAKTAWEMLDAAMAGDTPSAMRQLDRLMTADENPIALLGQISASLRRLAAATRRILQTEAAGRRVVLRDALEQSGVRSFAIRKTEQQLRRLGRQRGEHLYRWLLQADLDLKGDSAAAPRLVLERLIVRLSAPRDAISPA